MDVSPVLENSSLVRRTFNATFKRLFCNGTSVKIINLNK